MSVSIIIINYNTYSLTSKCIKSIYANTHDVAFEIILIDNASTECNPDSFKTLFPNITLFKSETNVGFAKGNNLGLSLSKNDIILFLNSDTELTEDSISICYNHLISKEDIGAITCKLKYPNNLIQHNCQSFPSAIKMLVEKLRLHKLIRRTRRSRYLQGIYWDYETEGFPDWIWGTFFMFKRKVLLKLPNKKLHDDYFMYIEDIQWCLDFRKANIRILYTPKTTVIHYGGGSLANTNDLITKNYKKFLKENYSTQHINLIKFISRIS